MWHRRLRAVVDGATVPRPRIVLVSADLRLGFVCIAGQGRDRLNPMPLLVRQILLFGGGRASLQAREQFSSGTA